MKTALPKLKIKRKNQARALTKKHAKTFYFASLFLSKEQRIAAYNIYAICRLSDDSVDQNTGSSDIRLAQMKNNIEAAYSDVSLNSPLLLGFRETVQKFDIPKKYFDDLLSGMQMDLVKKRYETFQELYDYCYRVAGVVGLIMLKVFNSSTPKTEKHAVQLGVAMQLTNICRDIKEDFLMGRIYIPNDDMKEFGLTQEKIATADLDDTFKNCLRYQISRARQYYRGCMAGIPLIKKWQNRLVICLMKDLYSSILIEIEKSNYNVYKKRAHLKAHQKVIKMFKVFMKREYLLSYQRRSAKML